MAKIQLKFPDFPHFSMSQKVGIQDVNYRKHLAHDKLVSLLHNARAAFLASIGISEVEQGSEGYILADLQIVYINEAFYEDRLIFDIAVSEISGRSCQMHYQVRKCSEKSGVSTMIARAKTSVVFFNYETKKAIAAPTNLMNLS
ncbi:MAG: acyl-CoA thioesterase [Endozoicomonas sp. (ex Botrylloides leachii)]|nr:acyl-CoA thioesterase [Endozoicomonas sp. (ex Botrylloides leachii)]